MVQFFVDAHSRINSAPLIRGAFERAPKMSKLYIAQAILALFFIAISPSVYADGVYKWVDVNGHAHYTDKKPSIGDGVQLHIQPEPTVPVSKSNTTAINMAPMQDEYSRQLKINNDKREEAERNSAAIASKKREEASKLADEQMAKFRATSDERLMDECTRNREIYCDKGVNEIKNMKEKRAQDHEDMMDAYRRNPNWENRSMR